MCISKSSSDRSGTEEVFQRALQAKPNAAHLALAAFANQTSRTQSAPACENFALITQVSSRGPAHAHRLICGPLRMLTAYQGGRWLGQPT